MSRVRRGKAVAAARRLPWAAPALALIGGIALAIGMLVYMTDRDPAHAVLFPAIAALDSGPIFGILGPCLPSFVHPFAFSLITAAALPRAASAAYGACVAWWAVNMAFELGQHAQISGRIAESLQLAFGDMGLARPLSNYFLRGSFDVGDIAAATAGSLAAALVLHLMHRLEIRDAH